MILFADDMTLYLSGPSLKQLIDAANQELHQLYQWCASNRLTIATDNTQYMLFTNKKVHQIPLLNTNNYEVSRTSSVKFLDVTFEESMTFKIRINKLIQ